MATSMSDPEKRGASAPLLGEARHTHHTPTDTDSHPPTPTKRRHRPLLLLAAFLAGCFLLRVANLTPSTLCWSPFATSTTISAQTETPHDTNTENPPTVPSSSHQGSVQSRDVVDLAATTTSSAPTPSRTVLKCFEVDQPVLLPGGAAESDGSGDIGGPAVPPGKGPAGECTVLLMRRDFAWSYEDPFVGEFF